MQSLCLFLRYQSAFTAFIMDIITTPQNIVTIKLKKHYKLFVFFVITISFNV